MLTIAKVRLPYSFHSVCVVGVSLPVGAEILHIDCDPHEPRTTATVCMWVRCEDQFTQWEQREFVMLEAGNEVPSSAQHLASLSIGVDMWHVFEIKK